MVPAWRLCSYDETDAPIYNSTEEPAIKLVFAITDLIQAATAWHVGGSANVSDSL